MRASPAVLAALIWGLCLGLGACGGSADAPSAAPERTPLPAPEVKLTGEEKQLWAKAPPDRSSIPVLLYHGIGPETDFSNAADASYGVDVDAFAKQMTEIKHAGYETVGLPDSHRLRQREAASTFPRDLYCSPSTTRVPTPGRAPTASCASWGSTPSCSSTWAGSTTATAST